VPKVFRNERTSRLGSDFSFTQPSLGEDDTR
jgi:hypothetical protein